ncbi:MAG: hypothetical protein KGO96_10225 [Elusimicrobia bacterium]|nr:hypothetical protein [Elusimicrobiota bacterium]
MSVLSEVRLKVARRVNLGNYEHVELEATVTVGRNSDEDTPDKMRAEALDEIAAVLDEAVKDHVPKRRRAEVTEKYGE